MQGREQSRRFGELEVEFPRAQLKPSPCVTLAVTWAPGKHSFLRGLVPATKTALKIKQASVAFRKCPDLGDRQTLGKNQGGSRIKLTPLPASWVFS